MQFRWFIKFLLFLLVISCAESALDSQNINPVGHNMCNLFHDKNYTQISDNFQLSEIIIGVSNFEDIKTLYGEPIRENSFTTNSNKDGCVYQYKFKEEYVHFYFLNSNNVVCGIDISPLLTLDTRKSLITLGEMIEKNGIPELVGYTPVFGSNNRTVVWLEKGIQTSVYLNNSNQDESSSELKLENILVINLGYFYPTTQKNYNDTCLSAWYSEQPSKSDVFDAYPKNPFYWE